ncbi:hypothetical protein [Xanthomonas albilineans]|uniref:hypothetical protein n=1 Tax=Xanthomonas albilineans TaxID=29447 RepID=UPI001E5259B7|nr:hypothetical protein [Xanthomonas albilineans]
MIDVPRHAVTTVIIAMPPLRAPLPAEILHANAPTIRAFVRAVVVAGRDHRSGANASTNPDV